MLGRINQLINEKWDPSQKAVLVFTVLGFLPLGVRYLLFPIYVRFLSPEEYGVMALLTILSSSYAVFASFQLKTAAGVNYFKEEDKVGFEKSMVSSVLYLSLITLGGYLLISSFFFSTFIGNEKYAFLPFGILTLVTAFFTQIQTLFFTLFRNKYSLKALTVFTLLSVFLSVPIQFYLVVLKGWGVLGVITGSFIASGVVFLGLIITYGRLLTLRIDYALMRRCFTLSAPMIPSVLIHWVMSSSDRVILKEYFSTADLGIYAVLLSIISISLIFTSSYVTAIKPRFYAYLKESSLYQLELEKLSKQHVGVVLLVLSFCVFLTSNLGLLTDEKKYLDIVQYAPLAALAFLPALLLQFIHQEMLYESKAGRISLFLFLSVCVQLALLFLLVPSLKIQGALLSLTVSSMINFFLCYGHFKRSKVPHRPLENLLLVLTVVIGVFFIRLVLINVLGVNEGVAGFGLFLFTVGSVYFNLRKKGERKI